MFQPDLFAAPPPRPRPVAMGLADVVRRIAEHSARPRYTFMVLDLIARIARPNGEAGPLVRDGAALVPIREWLAAAIAPSSHRHSSRRAASEKVRRALAAAGALPADPEDAERLVEQQVQERLRDTGKTAVSRAVSELVAAGLVRRHYQGHVVDHENRGAQRHAVYSVTPAVRAALGGTVPTSEDRRDVYSRGTHGHPQAGSGRRRHP
ncbi:hypothetical protein GCM10011380_33420 [Sphingomonas metalli]|uniref:Uncharacterized protein n=1 Tax=Sphingomonas metalli TaxID=1779358 RepID=A0A916WYT9_9SPHN|nr:hypothetical protein [Sphingomonas metalli]GGB41254.1 hypothetical protein GCM10011380_33420 [Sphingomonas metalli]